MQRPCFLVVDREFAGSISTRKLLIETAKFNVITAYSGGEAIELFRRFPAVSGIVLDASLGDMECEDLIREVKRMDAKVPVISIEGGAKSCDGADYAVPSFDPAKLLEVLRGLRPDETEAIDKRDAELNLESEREQE
jgi:DNA-binding response OmpR family regulator